MRFVEAESENSVADYGNMSLYSDGKLYADDWKRLPSQNGKIAYHDIPIADYVMGARKDGNLKINLIFSPDYGFCPERNKIYDDFAKVLTKIYSHLIFDFSKSLKNRGSIPFHIILEEAHRYIQSDHDRFLFGYNIFERIAKEGRKYGVILGIITQRPVELSDNVISQCTNFLIFKINHPMDIKYIREMVPHITDEIIEKQKALQPGTCLGFGLGFKIPLIIRMQMPDPSPLSGNCDVVTIWSGGRAPSIAPSPMPMVGGIQPESNVELPSIAVPSGFSAQNEATEEEPTTKNKFIPETVLAVPEEEKKEEEKPAEPIVALKVDEPTTPVESEKPVEPMTPVEPEKPAEPSISLVTPVENSAFNEPIPEVVDAKKADNHSTDSVIEGVIRPESNIGVDEEKPNKEEDGHFFHMPAEEEQPFSAVTPDSIHYDAESTPGLGSIGEEEKPQLVELTVDDTPDDDPNDFA